jgi:hypothetical protein
VADDLPVWILDDGGRSAAGRKGTGDCVIRALALIGGYDYMDVYRDLHARQKAWGKANPVRYTSGRTKERSSARLSPRNGVYAAVWRPWMIERGWTFTKCTRAKDFPRTGAYIVEMVGHFAAVRDWVLYDTWDSFRRRRPRFDGYWTPPAAAAPVVDDGTGQLLLFAA